MVEPAAPHPPDELLLGFTRALRASGLAVTADRAQTFLRAVAAVGLDHRQATYWAGRATLCCGPDDFERYDQVFHGWFLGDPAGGPARPRPALTVVQAELEESEPGADEGAGDADELTIFRATASADEVLRHRDIAELSAEERKRLACAFVGLHPVQPRRPAYRHVAWRRGTVDRSTTLRRTLSRLGEPVEIAWQHRSTRPRRVVLLVDVSGSMGPYADALLRLAHRFTQAGRPGSVEVFTLGTRITRVTRAMRLRDPDQAIAAAGQTVPDWSGGTRLGETLKAFLDRWGQRGLARGSVVVMFSDGWERGDAALLGAQMQRLHLLAHRVVWVNPHRGRAGYSPVQLGMAAALPHVDDFVAGHSLAAFGELVEVVASA